MYYSRITLVFCGNCAVGSYFTRGSLEEPELQSKRIGDSADEAVLGIGLKSLQSWLSPEFV